MIRVGFWYDRPQEYSGGLNYIRNLLLAIAASNPGVIEPYVFFATGTDVGVIEQFGRLATVVQTSLLKRGSLAWFMNRLSFRLFRSMRLVARVLRRHQISVVSHAEHFYGRDLGFVIVSWIPDFQYLHLPELFPGLDVNEETRRLSRIVEGSDAVVLSSYAALNDFKSIMGQEACARVRVLQFVSQPRLSVRPDDELLSKSLLEQKYSFTGRYFYLPNQFWRHKNHRVVFEAVRSLKQHGVAVLVLCTGNLIDYRYGDSGYAQELLKMVDVHGLGANIRILGMVQYLDVLSLMLHCIAVVNPSRHEGWSSAVEEAKGLGKPVVVSRIPVHVEQNAPGAEYFAPDDPEELARILERLWSTAGDESQVSSRAAASEALRERTVAYGKAYIELITEVMNARLSELKRICKEA